MQEKQENEISSEDKLMKPKKLALSVRLLKDRVELNNDLGGEWF